MKLDHTATTQTVANRSGLTLLVQQERGIGMWQRDIRQIRFMNPDYRPTASTMHAVKTLGLLRLETKKTPPTSPCKSGTTEYSCPRSRYRSFDTRGRRTTE